MMTIRYEELFRKLHPDFFASKSISSLPPEQVYEEQILDLSTFSVSDVQIECPEQITFGLYAGDMDALHAAVGEVDENWVKYFRAGDRIFCAFDGDRVVSFCLLDDFGCYENLRIGGPGCVGTVPGWRRQGIGLQMVQSATAMLKDAGYDLSYIHYTGVGHWYARLGYRTIVQWNANGIL